MSHDDVDKWEALISLCATIAQNAHEGQLYGDQPYFQAHVLPLATFFLMRGMHAEACVALLHDTIEDRPDLVSEKSLRDAGIPSEIVEAVLCITKLRGEPLVSYYARVRSNVLAWRVKLRDVLSNISAPGATAHRILKYAHALQVLSQDAPAHIFT